ncbi:hypothetical protein [Spiractinospora alimapuensis]|uniref:hypothetical protein n=1 Tax=Spiractinospora alimapuensis TaxID=2820884 RepID=UPI001F2E7B7B|nr:hypothetical protein [Spiractinospora alimapuensis]
MRELAMALPIYPQILLVGNVRDEYYLPAPHVPDAPTAEGGAPLAIHRLPGVVRGLLAERDYAALAVHDIVTDSLTLTPLRDDVTPPAALTAKKRGNTPGVDFPRLTDTLTALTDNLTQPPTALLIEHAGGLTTPADTQPEPARLFFTAAEALAVRARVPIAHGREQPYNTVLWVADRVEDLPASFAVSNPRLRVITVPPPSPDVRAAPPNAPCESSPPARTRRPARPNAPTPRRAWRPPPTGCRHCRSRRLANSPPTRGWRCRGWTTRRGCTGWASPTTRGGTRRCWPGSTTVRHT